MTPQLFFSESSETYADSSLNEIGVELNFFVEKYQNLGKSEKLIMKKELKKTLRIFWDQKFNLAAFIVCAWNSDPNTFVQR